VYDVHTSVTVTLALTTHYINTITKRLQLTGSITQRNNTMDTMG